MAYVYYSCHQEIWSTIAQLTYKEWILEERALNLQLDYFFLTKEFLILKMAWNFIPFFRGVLSSVRILQTFVKKM